MQDKETKKRLTHIASLVNAIKRENLPGVTSNFANLKRERKSQRFLEFDDLDAQDPRWFDLFYEHFIANAPAAYDDLLFFVRLVPTSPKTRQSLLSGLDTDTIFVRRRETCGARMPSLSDPVCWKQTLFLNWIVQSPMLLTMVRKAQSGSKSKLVRLSSVVYPSPFRSTTKSQRRRCTREKSSKFKLFKPTERPPSATSLESNESTVSELSFNPDLSSENSGALKALHILHTQKCTFPWINFSPSTYCQDGDSRRPSVRLFENDCLCVELAMFFENTSAKAGCALEALPHSQIEKLAREVEGEPSNATFPNIDSLVKLTLFQGFVPYRAISDTFKPQIQTTVNSKDPYSSNADCVRDRTIAGWFAQLVSSGGAAEKAEAKAPASVTIKMQGPDEWAICTVKVKVANDLEDTQGHSQLPLDCSLSTIGIPWCNLANDLLNMASNFHSA